MYFRVGKKISIHSNYIKFYTRRKRYFQRTLYQNYFFPSALTYITTVLVPRTIFFLFFFATLSTHEIKSRFGIHLTPLFLAGAHIPYTRFFAGSVARELASVYIRQFAQPEKLWVVLINYRSQSLYMCIIYINARVICVCEREMTLSVAR